MFKNAISSYIQRTSLNPDSVYFLSNDKQINPEQTVESQMNEINRQNRKIEVTVVPRNKPLENAYFLRKEGDLNIYLFPSNTIIIGNSQNEESEKSECINLSKQINRKILLFFGEINCGKTTLINSLVNALCDIQLQDNFRYIITEEFIQDTKKINSTKNITIYNLDGFKDKPPITIIDTPGFGGETQSDEKLIEMMKKLINDYIDNINALCFVAHSNKSRLTFEEKNRFNNILNLFGNDIKKNFIPIFTFCDIKQPLILNPLLENDSTFRNFIYNNIKDNNPWYFQCNNSAIFENDRRGMYTKLFWEKGMEELKMLFGKINNLSKINLNLSKSVLKSREILENKTLELKTLIEEVLPSINAIKNNIKEIKKYNEIISDSKNFTFKIKCPKMIKEDLKPGIHTTTCLKCNITCHENCPYADNKEKKSCKVMDSNGYCTVCPGKCFWDYHKNLPYILKIVEIEEERTVEDLKSKYYDSLNQLSNIEQTIKNKELEIEQKMVGCYAVYDEIKNYINQLNREALYINAKTQEEYIDLQIEKEKSEQKEGFEERIKILESIKQNKELVEQIFLVSTNCRNFDELKSKIISGEISFVKDKKLTKEEKEKLCVIF